MPYATLLKPASLRIGKLTFLKGVKVPVTTALAEALEINPRFKIDFRGEDEAGAADVADTKLPAPAARRRSDLDEDQVDEPTAEDHVSGVDIEAVAEAIDGLDLDDDDAFLDNGLPNPAAVSRALDVEVTAADIAAAMRMQTKGQKKAATAGEIAEKQSALAGTAKRGGVKIIRKPKPAEDDDTAGAVEA